MTCTVTPNGVICSGKMVRVRSVVIDGKHYNIYVCNKCGREVYGSGT